MAAAGRSQLSDRLLPRQLIDEQLKGCMIRSQQQLEKENWEILESLTVANIGYTMLKRHLFITQEGRIGSAANKAEIENKSCVIFGCAYLVVLRAKDDGFVVVGDAYIDGLGVVEAERELEEGKFEVEKFNIRWRRFLTKPFQ
jgi:hypothetical protein